MTDVRRPSYVWRIAGIDDDKAGRHGEQRAHVVLEGRIFNKVVDNIKREREIKAAEIVWDLSGQVEALRSVPRETPGAKLDRGWRNVDADVAGILAKIELPAVAASQLNHGLNLCATGKG